MIKKIAINDLYDCKIEYLKSYFDYHKYPWELISNLKDFIKMLLDNPPEGFSVYADGILVGNKVKIYPTAVIEAPAIIGEGTVIRPGAFIRGSVIVGKNCVVGNSTELKNCILLDDVQVPHYNYVGDSVLGNHAHMGAGSILSNVKADNKNVVIHSDVDTPTGLRKVGAFLGDGADIGCGCVLNPGTVVGKNTSVYPLTCLRGVYPCDCIVKEKDVVVKRK